MCLCVDGVQGFESVAQDGLSEGFAVHSSTAVELIQTRYIRLNVPLASEGNDLVVIFAFS